MKDEYIILRTVRPKRRGRFLGFNPRKTAEPTLVVTVNEIDDEDVTELRKDPDVEAVCRKIPLRLVKPFEVEQPQDALTDGVAWGVKAVGADNSPYTGENVVVAVLDTGVDDTHPAFSGVEVSKKDFTGEGDNDVDGHGTHCAATILGRDVDGKRIGVARGVKKLLAGKVLGKDGGTTTSIAQAIQWAVAEGAHVISLSIGMDFPGLVAYEIEERGLPPELATSQALEEYRANIRLFDTLANHVRSHPVGAGSVLIAAAGNDSRRQNNPEFEIGVSFPAVTDGFISVAALGKGENGFVIAPFSNKGATVAGPGVDIVSAKPGGGLKSQSGTSMAAPHVAGVAALYAQRLMMTRPFDPQQVTAEVRSSGNCDGIAKGYKALHVGSGMVQAPLK